MSTKHTFEAASQSTGAAHSLKFFYHQAPFALEAGGYLPELRIAYQTFGELNTTQNNVVWVFHALTANSDPTDWWAGLIGDKKLINPEEHFIICANIIGSCYGSSGPLDFNPETGERYLNDFPILTIKDMVRAHQLLKEHLGIAQIKLGIGGSMGGQQLMEWAISEPRLFENIAIIACSARSSSWGKGIRASQRMAIEADPSFYSSSPKGGWKGLEAARAMAMISYRSKTCFDASQIDKVNALDDFRAESYQRYQGNKLGKRFNPRSYYTLNKAMDTHDVGRDHRDLDHALSKIKARSLVIGIDSDLLFSQDEILALAEAIPNAQSRMISSPYGHDGFLIETASITLHLNQFLKESSL